MNGHARSAECGKDIVCAAASMLLFTLAEALNGLERSGVVERSTFAIDNGSARISWTAAKGREAECVAACKAVCGGFRILAERYPRHVKVQG